MENQENKKETKWRQIYEDDNELDSDEDPDDFIANHEINQSKFISEILEYRHAASPIACWHARYESIPKD